MSELEPHIDSCRPWLQERLQRAAAILGCVAAVAAGGMTTEATQADTPDTIPLITKPAASDYVGKAVVIASEPQGYPIGNAIYGNSIKITLFSYSGKFAFGEIGQNQCGWVETDVIDHPVISDSTVSSRCRPYFGLLKDRKTFGKWFNGKPGEFDDGTFSTDLKYGCSRKAYYNYASRDNDFSNLNFPSGDEGLNNYAGRLPRNQPVHYRYTTLDGEAAMVRSDTKGWVFVDKSDCIAGYPQGGPGK